MAETTPIIQDEGFLYNDEIRQGIRKMSYSTNVLEHYDNVTYNISLFMFPKYIDDVIGKDIQNARQYEDLKIVIAKSGVNCKYSIKSLLMKTTYSGMDAPASLCSYSIKISLQEVMSCMLVNQLETVSRFFGYPDYLHRPFWLEISFTGYDPVTMMPVEKIPLSNGDDRLIFKGFMGDIKSQIDSNVTNWEINFCPQIDALLNKTNNILAITPIMKFGHEVTLQEFLEAEAKNRFNQFLETFPENCRDGVKKLINENNYITIKIINGDDEKAKEDDSFGKSIKFNPDINRNIDTNDSHQSRNDEENVRFDQLPQWALARTKGYQGYTAKMDIKPEIVGAIDNSVIHKFLVNVIIKKDIVITKDVENVSKVENSNKKDNKPEKLVQNKQNSNIEMTNLFNKCRINGTLVKKYCYGFSGQDTSVLEIMNNYDRLWYMNNIHYDVSKQVNENINNINKEKIQTRGGNVSSIASFHAFPGTKLGLMEDVYELIKNKMPTTELFKLNYPVRTNPLEADSLKSASQSNSSLSDAQTIVAINSFKKLYCSGQLSTTKFKIIGDPYWITPVNLIHHGGVKYLDSIQSKYPMAEDYRCVFGIKNFVQMNNGDYKDSPTDMTFEYSMNACGIYIIYKSETEFSDGKMIQTLYGTLDQHFIDDEARKDASK